MFVIVSTVQCLMPMVLYLAFVFVLLCYFHVKHLSISSIIAAMTWADAELNCVSQDANLVSIHSAGENNFVRDLIKNFDPANEWTWIGLSDFHKEGGWMWSDVSEVSFTLWSEGQPDNSGGEEDCVHINYPTRWNDIRCHYTHHSVCKSRAVSF